MPICELSKMEMKKVKLSRIKAKTALLVAHKTQSELAKELSISRRWIGAAFNGQNISLRTAEKIAFALGLTVDDLEET